MNKKLSRRQLLALMLAGAGITGLTWLRRQTEIAAREIEDGTLTPEAYLPHINRAGPTPTHTAQPPNHKVIHVHSSTATSWDFGNNYYGLYVNQNVVDAMVDRGVKELAGASTVAEAWRAIVPDYAPGKAIAIKVNFNNCWWCDMCRTDCDEYGTPIDALIQPINAVARGLLQAYSNFDARDIWIYDATISVNPPWYARTIPGRFKEGSLYPVRFFDHNADYCNERANYDSTDPSATITWRNPSSVPTPPAAKVTDILVNATYLINMPIMKRHVASVVTLSFKNHFGSIAYPNFFHEWLFGANNSGTTYNLLVDIYRNTHIQDKTVLTIGDGLFGNRKDNISKPAPWSTFGNHAPNSLLFSKDPVAIDCVMCDLLNAESALWEGADEYLVYAASVGLGIYERGNPWGSGYSRIQYQKIEL